MKKRLLIKYFIMCVLLILICSSGMSGARADQISDLEDEVSENEKKYDILRR